MDYPKSKNQSDKHPNSDDEEEEDEENPKPIIFPSVPANNNNNINNYGANNVYGLHTNNTVEEGIPIRKLKVMVQEMCCRIWRTLGPGTFSTYTHIFNIPFVLVHIKNNNF